MNLTPMHLHGHTFQVTNIDGQEIEGTMRDTVLVLPGSTVEIQFDADRSGLWMFHCHKLMYQAKGMMTTINYLGFPVPDYYITLIRGK
ncbi:MAG: multicopper oxidase domain-containing protein [Gammaproteobacteria bacterium]